MSARALQRLVVRLLHDPALVEAIYGGAAIPEITEEERALLLALDRRAWGTDPHRRSRVLAALVEEFPASAALVGIGELDAFFSSSAFHGAVQARQSQALAFGAWIALQAGPVALLETAIASARRDPPRRRLDPGFIVAAPGVRALVVTGGTLARLEAIRARLGPKPLPSLLRGGPDLHALPPLEDEEGLILERAPSGEIQVGAGAPSLVALLVGLREPRTREEAFDLARALGADPGEEAEILDALVADGLLLMPALVD